MPPVPNIKFVSQEESAEYIIKVVVPPWFIEINPPTPQK